MAAKNNTPDQAFYLTADQLKIGVYVYIDLPWFQHPFTLNSFRIASEEQIHALTNLGVARFRYDPERSLLPSDAEKEEPLHAKDETPSAIEEDRTPPLAEAANGKTKRIRILREHRQRIEKVNKAFLKSTTLLRNLNRNLMNTPTNTLTEMGELVDQMVLV